MRPRSNRIPLRKRLELNLFRRYRRLQTQLHELTYVFWECTLRCNMRCLHCGSDCRQSADAPDMPLPDFLRVLDEIREHADPHLITIALTGGEPLLRPDLAECGLAFNQRGFPWGMVSNGYLLTQDRLQRLVDAGLGSLTISLDGLRESHTWLRGRPDSFDRALEAITQAARCEDLVMDVVTCVNQKNFPELPRIRDLLIERGVKAWRLFSIFPKGRACNEPLLDLAPGQFRDLLEFIVDTRTAGAIRAAYGCEGFLGPFEGLARDSLFWCRAGINIGSVLADGSISACPSLRGDYIQGNIYSDGFWECWQERFDIMRDRRWTQTGECRDCPAYKWCEGNGLHLRDQQSGRLLRCHLAALPERLVANCGAPKVPGKE